ncbi:MAG: hypothetical protein MZU84_00395 [Sphingobacterium sp.]|nr:hypothetical protein [Sphingobacterium sp.]
MLKDYNNTGFVFFTNINSKKAMQLVGKSLVGASVFLAGERKANKD